MSTKIAPHDGPFTSPTMAHIEVRLEGSESPIWYTDRFCISGIGMHVQWGGGEKGVPSFRANLQHWRNIHADEAKLILVARR